MSINGAPFDQSEEWGLGLASGNAMTVAGILAASNLLAVISIHNTTGVVLGRDVTDFTAAAGTLQAATIDLSSHKFVAIWTNAPAA